MYFLNSATFNIAIALMTKKLPQKQIVAMGGGGWGMEPDNPLLDEYIYDLSDKKNLESVLFLLQAEIQKII